MDSKGRNVIVCDNGTGVSIPNKHPDDFLFFWVGHWARRTRRITEKIRSMTDIHLN